MFIVLFNHPGDQPSGPCYERIRRGFASIGSSGPSGELPRDSYNYTALVDSTTVEQRKSRVIAALILLRHNHRMKSFYKVVAATRPFYESLHFFS